MTCAYCGAPTIHETCDELCSLEASGVEVCWTCEKPKSECGCPPPRPMTTVRVRAGLL
jgi:hypothetical protein